MLILNQTLMGNEVKATLEVAKKFEDGMYMSYQDSNLDSREGDMYPTCHQAVLWDDPDWDANELLSTWRHKHFQVCLLEGLQRSRVKSLHHSKIFLVTQGAEKNPSTFLERLRKALIKHTYLSSNSMEVNLTLKDKFITQSDPDIRRKLQKLALRPDSTLVHLKVAMAVFHNESRRRLRRETGGTERRLPFW